MRGMGKSVRPMLITILGTCLLRIAWVYGVCPHFHGFRTIITVYPISWTVTGILMAVAYVLHWKKVTR